MPSSPRPRTADDHVRGTPVQRLREQQAGVADDRGKACPALVERTLEQRLAVDMEQVEGEIDDAMSLMRGAVLKRLERGHTGAIDGHDLAIDQHALRGHSRGGRSDLRVGAGKVLVVAGFEADVRAVLPDQRAVAIQLELVKPLVSCREHVARTGDHRLDEERRRDGT